MASAAGKIIGRAINRGQKQFLARIHPDLFHASPFEVQKTNAGVMQILNTPAQHLESFWISGSQPALSPATQNLNLFVKRDDCVIPIDCSLPFTEDSRSRADANFSTLATSSLLGLYQLVGVSIDREILQYLEAALKESLNIVNERERVDFAREFETELDATINDRGLSAHELKWLSTKAYIQVKSSLNRKLKRQALRSLCDCLESVEEYESYLGKDMPLIFISNVKRAICSPESLCLPPSFTPRGTSV